MESVFGVKESWLGDPAAAARTAASRSASQMLSRSDTGRSAIESHLAHSHYPSFARQRMTSGEPTAPDFCNFRSTFGSEQAIQRAHGHTVEAGDSMHVEVGLRYRRAAHTRLRTKIVRTVACGCERLAWHTHSCDALLRCSARCRAAVLFPSH